VTDKPVAVGFGISKPDQAAQVASWGADGIIVGSALVRALGEAVTPGAQRACRAAQGALAQPCTDCYTMCACSRWATGADCAHHVAARGSAAEGARVVLREAVRWRRVNVGVVAARDAGVAPQFDCDDTQGARVTPLESCRRASTWSLQAHDVVRTVTDSAGNGVQSAPVHFSPLMTGQPACKLVESCAAAPGVSPLSGVFCGGASCSRTC
jgi:hypothetical protein